MMEYKRLTKRDELGVIALCNACKRRATELCTAEEDEGMCCIREQQERLAELEDAIEQGKMIELPCKVGTIVYYVGSYQIGVWKKKIRNDIFEFPFTLEMLDTYGNNWFLTREEAEKRLKELQG